MLIELSAAFVILIALSTLSVSLLLFVYGYQKKVLKKQKEKDTLKEELQKKELETAYALLEGQEMERQRIAQDLHDHVGAMMTTIATYSELIDLKNPSQAQEQVVVKLKETTQIAMQEVRRVSHELDLSSFQQEQFYTAIENRVDVLAKSKNLQVRYDLSLEGIHKSGLLRDIYLILQELLTNTVKHAQATMVKIEVLTNEDGELHVKYKDNGKGMPAEQLNNAGIGMRNIESRVEKHGGQLSLESEQGEGLLVTLRVPHADR